MAIKFESFRGTGGGAVTGGLVYKGSYDAATNTPVLTSAKKGNFYIVSVAGSLAGVTLNVGDHIVFNQDASNPITSAMFDVIDNTDAVSSVNTQTGVVVLDTDDIAEGGTNAYFTNARADARIAAATANDLSDVSYTAGAGIDGYVMKYNNTSGNWEAQVEAAGAVTSVNTQTGAVVLDSDDIAEGTSNLYFTSPRFTAELATKDTDDLSEGATNLYYTNTRFDTQLATKDTDDISEGATNQYFTNARADARIAAATANDLSDVSYTAGAGIDGYVMTYNNTSGNWEAQVAASAPVTSVNTQTGAVVLDSDDITEGTTNLYYTNSRFDTQLATKDTDDLSEGATNQYFTNARADARISAATANDLSDVSYTAGAGIDGYVMKYNNTSGNWEAQAEAAGAVTSVNTQTGAVVLDSDDITEGATNLYYTNARFDTQLATKDTDDLSEGATNQYFTNARADARIAAATANDLSDVSYTAGAGIDGYVMTYNNTSGNWEAQVAASAPVTSVNTQTGAVVLDTDDVAEGASNLYYTNARFDTQLGTKTTDNLTEGASNLYYTNARFDTQLGTKTTDNLTEGSTNLYFTNARADARIAAATANDLSDVSYTAGAGIDGYVMTYNNTSGNWEAQVSASAPVTSVNTQTGAVVLDTDDVAEGASNLYYTNARADARIAAATANDLSDVSYTAGAGIDGYVMTYNNTSGNWEAQASAGGFTYTAITSASSPVSAAASTHYSADTSGGAITINLPALSGVTAGTEIRVKLKTAGNTLTLDGNLSETIDGSTTYTLTVQNQAVTLVSDGSSNWEVI